jgi:hypothetical protein
MKLLNFSIGMFDDTGQSTIAGGQEAAAGIAAAATG